MLIVQPDNQIGDELLQSRYKKAVMFRYYMTEGAAAKNGTIPSVEGERFFISIRIVWLTCTFCVN